MRNRWCLILALFVCLTGCSNKCETYTVFISMDAFRWDYPDVIDTPGLNDLLSIYFPKKEEILLKIEEE